MKQYWMLTECVVLSLRKRGASEVSSIAASLQMHGMKGPSRCWCGLPSFPQGCPHLRHGQFIQVCCPSIQVNLLNTGSKTLSLFYLSHSPVFLTVYFKPFFVTELIPLLISFATTPIPIATATDFASATAAATATATTSTSVTGMSLCQLVLDLWATFPVWW